MVGNDLIAVADGKDKPSHPLANPVIKKIFEKRPPFHKGHGLRTIRHNRTEAGPQSSRQNDSLQAHYPNAFIMTLWKASI